MDIESLDIKIVEDYRKQYESALERYPIPSSSIEQYHKWYDESRVLFDEYSNLLVINNDDPELLNFLSVDNDSISEYGLQRNFHKIRGSYLILLNRIKNRNRQVSPNIINNTQIQMSDSNKVFIVHGHDNELKQATARFIEQLGLNAIILHERPNSGRTIIQKLLEETNDSSYGIVLYSPCDEGKSKEEEVLHPRARQNVVFEHGLLIGKLGIKRVCCLYKGNVEIPSDNNGVLYIPYDENDGWKLKLAKEMRCQGLPINMDSLR